MTIKVLHLLNRLTFGGTERMVVHLVTHSRPEVVNFICSFDEPDPEFLSQLGPMKDRVFSLKKKGGNDLSLPVKIAAFCKQQDVDIVHSLGWGTYAEGIAAAKLFGRNRQFFHSFRGKTIEDMRYIPRRRIFAQRLFYKFCDVIITPSEMSRKEYANLIGIDPKSIVVIYNGVQIHDFEGSTEKNSGRDRFGIGSDDIVIGCVARLDPVKNVAGLIRAFAEMKPDVAHRCRLFIAGDGSELMNLTGLACDLGIQERVVFAGMRQDVPQCLRLMDLYVQPSKFEGMPNAVLEAMAAGLPVVATNVGGVSEIVEHGKTGFLVSLGDDVGLSDRMEEMVMIPAMRKAMGSAGRERVKTRFSMKKMISDYEKLYRQILKKGGID